MTSHFQMSYGGMTVLACDYPENTPARRMSDARNCFSAAAPAIVKPIIFIAPFPSPPYTNLNPTTAYVLRN